MHEKIMTSGDKDIKRIFNLDTYTYSDRALSEKTKELVRLSCSMVYDVTIVKNIISDDALNKA